jgi:hypothetical protein
MYGDTWLEWDTCMYGDSSERDTCMYGNTARNGISARTETRGSEWDTCTYGDTQLIKGYLHVRRHVAQNGIPARTETVAQNGIPASMEHSSETDMCM